MLSHSIRGVGGIMKDNTEPMIITRFPRHMHLAHIWGHKKEKKVCDNLDVSSYLKAVNISMVKEHRIILA